jgi:hypothetical protein
MQCNRVSGVAGLPVVCGALLAALVGCNDAWNPFELSDRSHQRTRKTPMKVSTICPIGWVTGFEVGDTIIGLRVYQI